MVFQLFRSLGRKMLEVPEFPRNAELFLRSGMGSFELNFVSFFACRLAAIFSDQFSQQYFRPVTLL